MRSASSAYARFRALCATWRNAAEPSVPVPSMRLARCVAAHALSAWNAGLPSFGPASAVPSPSAADSATGMKYVLSGLSSVSTPTLIVACTSM